MEASPGSRVKVLVVDDMPGQRQAIEAALAELGEEIIAVGSGVEALRVLLDHDVAVILLDVTMPDMDGFETASLVRQRPRSRHTPIIFLTAHMDEMAAARAYSLGAVDYIFNPFAPDVLRAKVRVFVELSRIHERMRREAEHRIALSRAQAARAAAEEESRRLRVLAEASGVLTRSLDTRTLVADLLALFVPLVADLAAISLTDAGGHTAETSWLDARPAARVSRDPVPDDDGLALNARLEGVVAADRAERIVSHDGQHTQGIILPLVARGRTFGAMASLMRLPRRYSDADLDLVRDIAGRAAIALDNSRLYQEIHERDRQKDEFLAMLSHELRNPLGAITTAVRLLEVIGTADERATRAREVIGRQAGHLARMVDDLLDVARLTVGQIALDRAPIDLADVVARALDALRVSGRLEHHAVTVKADSITVDADFDRLEQVVTNLLVNAAKYTDRGGCIHVEVRADGDEAVVRVRDTGIGISAEMLPRLFDLFTQGRQALDRAQGGLGIGLTLVRRLVELHGGSVAAASEGPGRGSVFTVRLPRATREKIDDGGRGPGQGDRAPLRILLVEDSRDTRETLRSLLELAGHEVHEAADGFEAVRVACRVNPQLALIDIGLPGLDGLQVASRIRDTAEGNAVVLVAVTGYGQLTDRRKALAAGFDLHLTKPVEPERLDEVLALAARRSPRRKVIT
ncbi:MAG TPA: response regulator [Methylomirabilota bacterium]|nr:response regulator [Methylomirabilota bacterium]